MVTLGNGHNFDLAMAAGAFARGTFSCRLALICDERLTGACEELLGHVG